MDLELDVADVPGLTNRIKELRLARGLTLEELEARSGVHASTISRLEQGLMKVTTSYLGRLSAGLDCHPAELLADLGSVVARDDRERELLARVRALAPEGVEALLTSARAMMAMAAPPRE